MPKNKEPLPLEDAMQQLETLVIRMESGELSLDESLKAFEQGVELSKQCQQALQQAEQRVKVLLSKTTDAEPVDFDSPASAGKATTPSTQDTPFNDDLPF